MDKHLVERLRRLGLPDVPSRVALSLPDDMPFEDWVETGKTLLVIERSVGWWLGDWWAFGESHYGSRSSVLKQVADAGLKAPSIKTCKNAAVVSRAFDQQSRRRDLLTWAHHAEVAALPAAEQDALLDWCEETVAGPDKKVRSTHELRAAVSQRRAARTLGCQSANDDTCTVDDLRKLAAGGIRYGCIYADPPWPYDNQGTRGATGKHYAGLTVDQLAALPVRDLAAADAHLHLWTTNGFLKESIGLMEAWGFELRSTFVWVKPQLGMGNYWRNSHELLLTGIRGNAKRFRDKSLRSWVECDRGEHSAKPEQVRSFIERASPGPYLELFGRSPATGWTVFGNQVSRGLLFHDVREVA